MAITDLFQESWYLRSYPDIAAAVQAGDIDARTHFELYGLHEGRAPGPLFIPEFYLGRNSDVAAAVAQGLITAYDHFLNYGMAEGRSPVAYFDASFYLTQNPDVAAAVAAGEMSAIEHFMLYGLAEERSPVPWFNAERYKAANPDVRDGWEGAAFEHFLLFGFFEDRDLGNGIRVDFFHNDPVFNAAMDVKAFHDAVARIGAVAPFFPDFVPPDGWQAAPHTPIPIDFIPPEGMKLVVPPSVIIPDGMILPDTFEPVNPPGPGPGPGPGPSHDPDCGCDDLGTVCLTDGDEHVVGPHDQRFLILDVNAQTESDITIDGYEPYSDSDTDWELEVKHVIDLSKVTGLAVYDTEDGRRLDLETSGNNIVVSLSEGNSHIELIEAAGKTVNFHVGDGDRRFGYDTVKVDVTDLGAFFEDVADDFDSDFDDFDPDDITCGCLDPMPPLWGDPGTLLMGADGMQVFFLGKDNMALGRAGQDLFALLPQDNWEDKPAIIGDYRYGELDLIYLGPLSLMGGEVEPLAVDFLDLDVRQSDSEIDVDRKLVPVDDSKDLEIRIDGEKVLHIGNIDGPSSVADNSVVFTQDLGLTTATFNIKDGGEIISLFAPGSSHDEVLPYLFSAFLDEWFDASLVDGSVGLVEFLIGGDGAQKIYAGQTVLSILIGGDGDDVLTGHMGLDIFYGGVGADQIALPENTHGSGIVVFGGSAIENGLDEITNFTPGADGDTLDFSLFLSNGTLEFSDLIKEFVPTVTADGGVDVFSGPDIGASETGNEQIIVVAASTALDDDFVDDLGDKDRYVVVKGDAADKYYDIYFIDKTEVAPVGHVAQLEVVGDEGLCECNFSPWI